MSITKKIAAGGSNKLVIPYAGKMFRSNITKDNKALCFAINKGYIESKVLDELLAIIDGLDELDTVVLVGEIEKVHLTGSNSIVYRQRIFFKNLIQILNTCKTYGLRFELGDTFRISINSILNCTDELVFLERYAFSFNQTIDEWLTNCCVIHLNILLLSLNMYSDLVKRANKALTGRKGYLDRAPFLISSYSIDAKLSGIFIETDIDDTRLYSSKIGSTNDLTFGYTTKNIKKDIKGGAFK